ncbi:hypothetical protein PS15p_205074 [Mucor circinelloides]
MKYWSITATIYCILIHSGISSLHAADTAQLRSPQCVTDLVKSQVNMMQHFNGIFGDFAIKGSESTAASIYGPIAAFNITSNGYSYNSKSKMDCGSSNRIMRLGLMSKHADIQGDINGDVWTENGSIDTKGTDNCAFEAVSRVQHPTDDLVQSLFSFAPTTIKKTSATLSTLEPDTAITSATNGLVSPGRARSFNGYRILKLPACSDRGCAATSSIETNPNVLKGGNTWTGQYRNGLLPDEMIVFNVPVYIGGTFTISTLNVNGGISPCQAIFNFYAVNQAGAPVSDPNATFTLVRSPGVTVSGTILAPQARIIDASTGSFGGQLITLQSYEGHGADIKDFDAVSHGQCTSRSLCWPIVKAPRVVTAVVTATAKETFISTIKTDHAAASSMIMAEDRAALVSMPFSMEVTKTMTLSLPSKDHQPNVYKPVEFYADEEEEDEEEDEEEEDYEEDQEQEKTETVTRREVKIIHETTTHKRTIAHYSEQKFTVTETIKEYETAASLAFVTKLEPTTIIPPPLIELPAPVIAQDPIPEPNMAEDCQDEQDDNEEHHYHKHHKHHKGNKHWDKDEQQNETYDEIVSCHWQDDYETTVCVTHVNEEFGSVVPWQ